MKCDTCSKKSMCKEREYLINFMCGEIADTFADNCSGYEQHKEEITKEEIIKSLQETIKKVETMPKVEFIRKFNEVNPCEHCGCNPKNGGSGLCNCTLACPKIT